MPDNKSNIDFVVSFYIWFWHINKNLLTYLY